MSDAEEKIRTDGPERKIKGKRRTAGPVKKGRTADPIIKLAFKLAALAAAVFLLTRFVFGVSIYHGDNMFPALRDGDLVIISRLSRPARSDIVLYEDPQDGKLRFSRVIGLEGMEIDITQTGELKTNGYVPQESIFYRTEQIEGSSIAFPLTVPEGQIFILDDYRTIGRDSRVFGPVESSRIEGKVIYTVRRRGF